MLRDPLLKSRSATNLIRKPVAFKFWIEGPPPIEAARPNRCPKCGIAAGMLGGLAIVGHGVRLREIRGPERPYQRPRSMIVHCRRFACRGCGAIMTVVPLELGAWHRYALPALFWAIALFGLDGCLARQIRALVSPDQLLGQESRWRQLGRWIDQRSDGAGDRRARARRFAQRAAAMAGAAKAIAPLSAWDAALMETEPEALRNKGPPKEAAV